MKINYISAIATLITLNTLFLCHATEVFLHNSYGASIYYKASPTGQPVEIRNNVRAKLGNLNALEQADVSIAGGSALSVSYFSLKPTIAKIGFAASQQANSDAVIYVDPSSFYQAWNIRVSWEKRDSSISTFKSKEVLNQAAKGKLLEMLIFIRKPMYNQGQGKNQQIVTPSTINRTNDQAINMALAMVREEPYNEQLLAEVYDIINSQVPFQLSYQDEAKLKQNVLNFIRQEMNRLKQK